MLEFQPTFFTIFSRETVFTEAFKQFVISLRSKTSSLVVTWRRRTRQRLSVKKKNILRWWFKQNEINILLMKRKKKNKKKRTNETNFGGTFLLGSSSDVNSRFGNTSLCCSPYLKKVTHTTVFLQRPGLQTYREDDRRN